MAAADALMAMTADARMIENFILVEGFGFGFRLDGFEFLSCKEDVLKLWT